MCLFFQKYIFAFNLYLSAYLPCCLFYFKISLNSLQKFIFWVKPKQTPTPVQMCSDCNTSVHWESRLPTEPNWATLVADREFLLDKKILYLRPSSLDGMIFMPSRFGSLHICTTAAADSHMLLVLGSSCQSHPWGTFGSEASTILSFSSFESTLSLTLG